MGLHSPFGYVGYEVVWGGIIIMLLDKLCGGCHTDDDYKEGCQGCPAGKLIYECREQLLDMEEDGKRYAKYADDEQWLAKRRERYGENADPPEERERWRQLAKACKPEDNAKSKIKREIKRIIPHPIFFSRWIFDDHRSPDPLLKLRELVKDLDFIHSNRFNSMQVCTSRVNTRSVPS